MQLEQIFFGALLLGAALAAYIYYEIHSVEVRKYAVPIKGLPAEFDGFTILHLSDLHAKEYGREQKGLIALINRHDFDMIALTGDLIDYQNPFVGAAVNLVRGLKHRPAFFVTGNHERWVKTNLIEELAAEGVVHLRNEAVKLERGDEDIWVVGVEAPHAPGRVGKALLPIDDPSPKVLLAHSPNIFESAASHDIDLVLAGHTHGGQVRIPGVRTLYAPGQGLFPKYDHGLFSSGRTRMVVSAGLGESTLSIRFAIKPEVVLVKLTMAPG